jgi:Gpi18-like mannosyltransferase
VNQRPLRAADVGAGLAFYGLSSAIVLVALWFGHHFVRHPPGWIDDHQDDLGALSRFDGTWYRSIAVEGYSYDQDRESNVAFFPAYPLTARVVMRLTGCRPELALVLVAHFFLAATFVLLGAYVRLRNLKSEIRNPKSEMESGVSDFGFRISDFVLLSFALLPTTFFLRLGYTESMFCFWCVLILFGYERGWHPLWLALIAGAATATRAPGVALGLVVLVSLSQRSPGWGHFLRWSLLLGPLCLWGLIAFIAYQAVAFDEPLAFMKAQKYWSSYPGTSLVDGIRSVLIFEPIWQTYDSGSARYWAGHDPYNHTPFSLQMANPVYFLLTAGAVIWGIWKGRLTSAELLLGAALLLIPYLTRAYPNSMGSFGRFSAVVMPAYLVFGDWLRALPSAWLGLVGAALTLWLIAYSALFGAAWWLV